MSHFINIETELDLSSVNDPFDLIIVGGGAAGLTMTRELSGQNLRIAVLESGEFEETEKHEALNAVETSGILDNPDIQAARKQQNEPQLNVWTVQTQKFGVRCRVLGGSTAGWAGKVAPFDPIDFEQRPWIANSGWPIDGTDLAPYLDRAARHLDLGPMVQGSGFWRMAALTEPSEIAALHDFDAFFWQFARSRHSLTDVMRFGPDFRREHHANVTVFLNTTVASIVITDGAVEGVKIVSSLSGRAVGTIRARRVVLAAGAIENARLLLLSPGADHGPVGRYLTDHPSVSLGAFDSAHMDRAAQVLGFYPLREHYRSFMYSCGLALKPDRQREYHMPNMAAFMAVGIAHDDPLRALMRLAKRTSAAPLKDVATVVSNVGVISSAMGKKFLNYERIPERLRRLLADIVVFLNANMVAREFIGGGRGRQLASVGLSVIAEQPPEASNRITLSEQTDHLGLRRAHVEWELPDSLRRNIVIFGRKIAADLEQAGIKGFHIDPALSDPDGRSLLIHDMAHTAGTTRMGLDPETSVVDAELAVHNVRGLSVAGASVFPTSGHANPTLVIAALAIRLADRLKREIFEEKIGSLAQPVDTDSSRPLAVITGATGNLGRNLIDVLIKAGWRIRGQFRNTVPQHDRVEWVRCDFADPDLPDAAFDALVQGADAVINLAAATNDVSEMMVANVTNLDRLAQACVRQGVRYFGQASSMVVYGSPLTKVVSEDAPLIDLDQPLHTQYFAEPYMREYAKSKIEGEAVLAKYRSDLHVDIYRIAVAAGDKFLEESLNWSRGRKAIALYRNSHFIAPHDVARAIVHLMSSPASSSKGIEVYNIANSDSPTFTQVYRDAGRKTGPYIPFLFDLLKGFKTNKGFSRRLPMGAFRLDDSKLQGTGFRHAPRS